LLYAANSYSQDISLSQGLGGVAYNEPFDGMAYYSSVNIKYKFFSLSPTYIYLSKNFQKNGKFTWDSNLGIMEDDLSNIKGSIITSNSLRLFFNIYPLYIINKKSNIDLKIGIGYGIINEHRTGYEVINGNVKFFSEKIRTENNFMPIIAYNYYFKKIGIGLTIGVDGIVSDEAVFSTINFSIKL